MPFSTNTITNTKAVGTAASNIVINTRNVDTLSPATIMVQIFASVDSVTFYTAYVSMYIVPANSYDVRTFFIAGNVAYEVQISVTIPTPPNVLLSVFGLDGSGNLVTNQRILQSDLSFISALSPLR